MSSGVTLYSRNKYQRYKKSDYLAKSTYQSKEEVILDLRADYGVSVDAGNHIQQWKSVKGDIVFEANKTDYESVGIGNLVYKNGGIIPDSITNTFFSFRDLDDNIIFSGSEALYFIIKDIDFTKITEDWGNYIFTRERNFFGADRNFSVILRRNLPDYELRISANGQTIGVVTLSDINKLEVLIFPDGSNVYVIVNGILKIKSYSTSIYNYTTQNYINILGIGNGSQDNLGVEFGVLTCIRYYTNFNLDLTTYSVGDTIQNLPRLDLLPISREKKETTICYFSTFNKNTIINDTGYTVSQWNSDNSNIYADNSTSSYPAPEFTKHGLLFSNTIHNTLRIQNPPISLTEDWTVECWIKPLTTWDGPHAIITNNTDINIRIDDGNVIIGGTYFYSTTLESNSQISTNWNHIACVKYGTNAYIFINGILDIVGDCYEEQSEATWNIIGNYAPSTTTSGLDGYIDNLFIDYRKAKYNIAAVEIGDLAFLPPKRKSNVTPENLQWVPQEEVNDTILALSSKNNVTIDYLKRVSSWIDCFNSGLTLTQSDTSLMPKNVKMKGYIFNSVV